MMKIKNLVMTTAIAGVAIGLYQAGKKLAKSGISTKTLGLGLIGVSAVTAPSHAMSESSVQAFANAMKTAANSQNIGQLSTLIDDNAVISLTRQGKTTTLDKNAYLQLLQKSWAGASNYHYTITISDVVISGNQARTQVATVESWVKDGKKTTLKTNSRTTLQNNGSNAVLLRAVSQISIE